MSTQNRREFLQASSAALAAGAAVPYIFSTPKPAAALFQSKNDRPVLGCIGTGDRWHAVGLQALSYADCVAVCDVDKTHAQMGRHKVKEAQDKKGNAKGVEMYEDYRNLLDRKDINLVTIVTPDHWHAKIAIEAMQAGKDVYCEKPLTLTIDEGKQIIKVLKETGRVFQVGTQQRSEMGQMFLKAVAIAHAGRLGKITRVSCAIGGAPVSRKLPRAPAPSGLNWEMWLGQAPLVDYVSAPVGKGFYPQSRCHYEFRWWYEYSGGKMTDWGAHHVDIAQWAIGMDNSGPTSIEGTANHPVPLKDGHPLEHDRYNVADKFLVKANFPNGVEMTIRHDTDNGILIEGTEGRIFVDRSQLTGAAVDALKDNPLPEDALTKLYKGKTPGDHMGNFFECLLDRSLPVSDVYTHHRAMTTCHLANIAIRLGRKLQWDPQAERIVGDDEAQRWQSREQRKGYEIKA
jgi:predicted dehydrogenase